MKKLFALFLACIMLFLTSCNQTPPSETTGNSQNQENPTDSSPQDIIIRNGISDFIDTPSRILFVNPSSPKYTCYYSKVDGKAYVYCFDPLCDHAGGKCLANPAEFYHIPNFELSNTFFINGRFYTASQYGQIYSFSFDGSDLKIEYGKDSFTVDERNQYSLSWSPNFRAYDKYIYIPIYADENGEPCILRFNVETKEMENLTEMTGNCILPDFFYNGKIYGRVFPIGDYFKTNLDLTEAEIVDAYPVGKQFYGSVFFTQLYDTGYTSNNDSKTIGLEVYDIKTGEKKIITNEMLGLEANPYRVVAVDENYVYFYQYKKTFVSTYIDHNGKERNLYKENEGKLYRMKHDGTECTLIYDNPEFEFESREAVICEDKLIIKGRYIGIRNGTEDDWDYGMHIGIIGSDGKIERFEMMELVY